MQLITDTQDIYNTFEMGADDRTLKQMTDKFYNEFKNLLDRFFGRPDAMRLFYEQAGYRTDIRGMFIRYVN